MSPKVSTGSAVAERGCLSTLFDEVAEGLRSRPRRIPEKFFYDERGAALFEEITRLDEYYPTRLELGILSDCLAEIRQLVGPRSTIVEFGSGSGRKTELLLGSLDRPSSYLPVDISEVQLLDWADRIQAQLPELRVRPVVADFTRPFSVPVPIDHDSAGPGRPLFFFPGSSIGNFEPDAAESFLSGVGRVGGDQSSLLIGVDLVKEREVLEAAYDDPGGVTAEFNRNTLHHLNALFDGNFHVPSFEHRAIWSAVESRIEMRLVSSVDQTVTLHARATTADPLSLHLTRDDEIVTEYSYKYRPRRFEALCAQAGWATRRRWTDPDGWLSVVYLERKA